MACNPLIGDPFDFPRRAANRPGLPRIAYRIGRYGDFLEAMRRAIDAAPELSTWTHREADDPAIALLEGAAILGDILSFYQEHYANEAYLRTAAWRDSVAELVRLTGYRLAPGLGGRATLAFEARGAEPVTIRAGFPVRADLRNTAAPADLQTREELLAWPQLGRFHLYRPRRYVPRIPAGATACELAGVDGATDAASLAAIMPKAGDRLLLLPPEPSWTSLDQPLASDQAPQLVKLKQVTRLLDRVILEFEAPLQEAWSQPARAWRVNRAFRHFGQNAPPLTVATYTDAGGRIAGSTQRATRFERHVAGGHDCGLSDASIALAPTVLPLDAEVADLQPGLRIAVEAQVHAGAAPAGLCVVRTVKAIELRTLSFGNLNSASTLLVLDRPLVDREDTTMLGDVRRYRVHEITSPELTLRPLSTPAAGAFGTGKEALAFYGEARQARVLAGRRLWLSDGKDEAELVCTNAPTDFAEGGARDPRMWTLSFDRPPMPFRMEDFDEDRPAVEVFGNLVDATQGKEEPETVLGNGDARQSWQTFALSKAPLTWLPAPGVHPPYAPQLEVRVNGGLWTPVDAFYGHGPAEQVYVVREDAEGRAFVQFGDGETGARLPSGLGNVSARYRSGSGARGPGKPGAPPSALERPPGFDKLTLAGIVAGGAEPEDAERARTAAPGKVQGLGRLVSIRDYETEALALPGVVTAAASWDMHAGVPALVLRVLLAAGREAEFAAVRAALAHAQRCRGPDRFPLVVRQAHLRHAWADIGYAPDPARRIADVEAALRAALGLAGVEADARAGLFGLHRRRLGEPEYASRIEGRLQNVGGILWCKVSALGLLAPDLAGSAVAAAPVPPRPYAAVLPCAAHELLQLAPKHLTLTPLAVPAEGACI